MIEKIPPHNDEAERSVLGAAMLSKDALLDITDIVKPNDFYSEMHKEIFTAIKELYDRNAPVDTLTVSEELKNRNSLEMVGGRAYIASLSSGVPSTANAGQYAKIVAEKASLRSLLSASSSITEKVYNESMDADSVLDYAEREIFRIAQDKQTKDVSPLKDVLMKNIEIIDEASRRKGDIVGLTTGIRKLDDIMDGLHPSELIILAARPGMGKTAFALNVAQHAAIKGNASVLIFSLEMSKEQLGQRLISAESHVDMQKLRKGNLNQKDWDDINIALDTLSEAKMFIDDTPGISIMEIKNKCRRIKAEHGLDLVVLDYLQLMSLGGKVESRQLEISTITRQLKLLAREIDCPVIVLSQLSRASEKRTEKEGKEPRLSDLRESGSIEQDADVVLFLDRKSTETPEGQIIIAKQRSGPVGKIAVMWIGKYTKFVDKSNLQL